MEGASKAQRPIDRETYAKEQTSEETLVWSQIAKDADKAVAKIGRPSKRTKAIEDEILTRLANAQSLASICRLDHMPDPATVIRWTIGESEEDKAFCIAYNRARASQADLLFDSALDISDDESKDLIIQDDGNVTANPSAVARSKLRIETRMRMAGKISQKYADKPFIGEGSNISVTNNTLTVSGADLSIDQRNALRMALLQARDGKTIDG
jgi:uncharacterized membrane protein